MFPKKQDCHFAEMLCEENYTSDHSKIALSLSDSQMFDFGSIGTEESGYLTAAQFDKNVPFAIKRVYWTYLTPKNILRGNHAHRLLKQIIFAVSGEIEIEIESPDRQKKTYLLSEPRFGLYVPELHWRTLKFGTGAVLLSLASLDYDESEYIRDYNEFNKLCTK